MLKKQKQQSNSLFVILVFIILISYTGVIQLFYLGQYKQSSMFAKTKEEALRKHDLFCKYYGRSPKDFEELEGIQMEITIPHTYLQMQSSKALIISNEEAKEYIRNKKIFHNSLTGKFDEQKFMDYLEKISSILRIKISYFDYLEYSKELMAMELMEEIVENNMISISEKISKNLKIKDMKIHAIKVVIPNEEYKEYTPNKKEINEFITQKQKENGYIYVTSEKRSGFIIRVNVNKNTGKVAEAVNFYLNKRRSNFRVNDLNTFIDMVCEESKFFQTDVNLNEVFKRTKFVNVKHKYANSLLSVEHINEPLECSFPSECLFNENLSKNFDIYNGYYVKTVVTQVIEKKNKKLSKEDINNIVIPSLKLEKILLNKHKKTMEALEAHNHNTIDLIKSHQYNCEEIIYTSKSYNYDKLIFVPVNYGILSEDNSGQPCIIILKNIEIIEEENNTISSKDVNEYIKKNVFLYIFNLFIQKIKSKGL